jgi:hypothetical protein
MTLPLLCSQQSSTWQCFEPNNTPVTVFTTVHFFTMVRAKCYTCYSVHNNPLLEHILSQIIHPLLCSQPSTASPCSEPNDTPVTVFTTVHHLTMSSAKWYIYYCVQDSPPIDYVLCQMISLILCSQQSTTVLKQMTQNLCLYPYSFKIHQSIFR